MKTSFAVVLLVLLILAPASHAQLGPALWGDVPGGDSSWPRAIEELPGVGHVLASDFDYPFTLNGEYFDTAGADAFLTCMDGPGSHVWSRHIYGVEIGDIAVAPDGSVVIVGTVHGDYDLGEGAATAPETQMFMLSLDSAGAYQWSALYGTALPFQVVVDALGQIHVGGRISSTVDLGGGPLSFGGDQDAFLAKFSSTGTHIWSRSFGDAEFQSVQDLDVDTDGNVVVSGWGSGAFDVGLGVVSNPAPSLKSVILAAFSADGAPRFGTWIESPLAYGNSVACGPDGAIFVVGSYSSWIKFDGTMVWSVYHDDIYVAKFSPLGALSWYRSFGTVATTDEKATNVLIDGAAGIVVSGEFQGTEPIDFGGGPVSAVTLSSAFVLFLDNDGTHRASYGFNYGPTRPNSLARGADGGLAFAGDLSDSPYHPNDGWVDFGSGTLRVYDEGTRVFLQIFGPAAVTGAPSAPRTRDVLLHAARPNPFNPATTVSFTVTGNRAERVRLRVFDVSGRIVRTLFEGEAGPGTHDLPWDGRDSDGRSVVSGTYFCRLDSGSDSETTKLTLVK